MDEVIKLNVGGAYFTTTRATLCAEAGSMLAIKFGEESNFAPPVRDPDGNLFLDRDPTCFKYLMGYLRLGCRKLPQTPKDADLLGAIKDEADYFGLVGLVHICDMKISAAALASAATVSAVASTRSPSKYKIITKVRRVNTFRSPETLQIDDGDNADDWLALEGYRVKDIRSCTTTTVGSSDERLYTTVLLEKDN